MKQTHLKLDIISSGYA